MDDYLEEYERKEKIKLLELKTTYTNDEENRYVYCKEEACNFQIKITYNGGDATIYSSEKHKHDIDLTELGIINILNNKSH